MRLPFRSLPRTCQTLPQRSVLASHRPRVRSVIAGGSGRRNAFGPRRWRSRLRLRIGQSRALRFPRSASTRLSALLVGAMECNRQDVCDDPDQGLGPVSDDLRRLTVRTDRIGEGLCGGLEVSPLGHEHFDDRPVLVNRPRDAPPGPRPSRRSRRRNGDCPPGGGAPSRVDEQGRESPNPSDEGHMTDLDAAIGEQVLEDPNRTVCSAGNRARRSGWPRAGTCIRRTLQSAVGRIERGIGASPQRPLPLTAKARFLLQPSGVAPNATVPAARDGAAGRAPLRPGRVRRRCQCVRKTSPAITTNSRLRYVIE